jgi:hypothetical protein
MSQLRKIQRNGEKLEAEAEEADIPEHHLKLPVGKVLTAPVKGDFLTIPLCAWFSRRLKVGTPLLMLRLLLISGPEDGQPKGLLEIELPIFDDTERATLAVLNRYGWDGRVWPLDEGWPNGNSDEENQLRALLEQAKLQATLTFPPGETGISAQAVTVSRARGPFLMPPLPAPEGEADPEKLARFRELYMDPTKLLCNSDH